VPFAEIDDDDETRPKLISVPTPQLPICYPCTNKHFPLLMLEFLHPRGAMLTRYLMSSCLFVCLSFTGHRVVPLNS